MTFKIFPFSKYIVHGNSMLPALRPGQHVLTLNWFCVPKVGNLVVIQVKDEDIIKRVQKTSNQRVYVLGDNQKMSTDSKSFGWVDKSAIIGKVIWISQKESY